MFVRLRPGLRQVWRGPQTVQIGLTAGRCAVLDGLTTEDARLLDNLRVGLDLSELDAGRVPPGPSRGREILRLLGEGDVLLTSRSGRAALARLGPARERLAPDAAAWALALPGASDGWELLARRASARVLVRGGGRTASALTATLAAAGVPVTVDDPRPVQVIDVCPLGPQPPDVGRVRQDVAAELVARARGAHANGIDADRAPDVVVLVEHAAADASAAQVLQAREVAHLSVVIREGDVVVGPLVRPGRGPCLHCLDLHRADRDPRWPHVLAQLLSGAGQPAASSGCEEVVLSTLAGSLAALQVLSELDGRADAAAAGATLELELPDGLVCRRPWPAHPSCGCAGLPGRLPENWLTPGRQEPGARPPPATVTMAP